MNGKLCILLILFYSNSLLSQNFIWNKVHGYSNVDLVHDITNGLSGNYTFILSNVSSGNSYTQTLIDTINLYSSNTNGFNVVSKFDTSGRVQWAKSVLDGNPCSGKIHSDWEDNVYIVLSSINDDTFKIIDSIIHFPNNLGENITIIIKLDKTGNLIWYRIISNSVTIDFEVSDSYIYLLLVATKDYIVGSDTIRTNNYGICVFDSINNNIRNKPLIKYKFNKWSFTPRDLDVNFGQIRVIGNTVDNFSSDTVNWNFQSGFQNGFANIVMSIDVSSGICTKIQTLSESKTKSFSTVIHRIKLVNRYDFFITGIYKDTLKLNNDLTHINTKINNNGNSSFIAFYKNNKFSNIVYITDTANGSGTISLRNIDIIDGFVYASGVLNGDFNFGGFNASNTEGRNFFLKSDTTGSVLWVIRVGGLNAPAYNSTGFAFDKYNGIYFASTFTDSIKFNGSPLFPNNFNSKNADFIHSKIHDYSITRGPVKYGPYCAGDKIVIPYTIDGVFNFNNEFIAQLSNENGIFDINTKELGRLKCNKDSFIIGTLPLFNVITSRKYRIRIISTFPRIQSYFKYDSLRLLIFSKDTANAGGDTTICYGSTLSLRTSGGSKWRWSPSDMVIDSSSRITMTQPIFVPTKFRIIISDSSGCGKTDTAYKWIYPMQKLEVLNKDTTVCRSTARIPFLPSGGEEKNYRYEWFNNEKKSISRDSLFQFKDTMNPGLWLKLDDDCSQPSDTTYIFIKLYDSLKSVVSDSIICNKLPITIKAIAKGGNGAYYYKWFNSNNSLNNQTDSLSINSYGIFNYKLIVDDLCSNPIDTASIQVKILNPLEFSIPNDTILCYGSNIKIQPKIVNGHKTEPFKFIKIVNNVKDTFFSDSFDSKFYYSGLVKVSAKDRCQNTISDSVYYSILPPVKLQNIKDTVVCTDQLFRLKVQVTGGNSPIIKWYASNNVLVAASEDIDTSYKPKDNDFIFIGSDECSAVNDTVKMKLSVLQPLSVKLQTSELCYKDSIQMLASVKGGKRLKYKYLWHDQTGGIGADTLLYFNTLNKPQTIFFTLSDDCSTPSTDSINLTPMAIAEFAIDNPIQCIKGNLFNINTLTDSNRINFLKQSFYWSGNPYINSFNFGKHQLKYNDTGKFKISLLVSSNSGLCIDSIIKEIVVKPMPKIDVNWIRTTSSFDYSNWRFSAKSDQQVLKYTWNIDQFPTQTGDTVFQEFHYTGIIKINVTADSKYGCSSDTTIDFNLQHKMRFYIPNIITTNGDGINESFYIPGKEYMSDYSLKIFNRWGEMLFDSNNPDEAFMPSDYGNNVYLYVLNIFDIYNERHELKGTFMVSR